MGSANDMVRIVAGSDSACRTCVRARVNASCGWRSGRSVRVTIQNEREETVNEHLRHKDEMLLASLLAGKLPLNLSWTEVVELIAQLGEVKPHGSNEFAFVVGSQRAFFKRPNAHSLEVHEVSSLRKFLREATVTASSGMPSHAGRTVVVVDHHSARLYQELGVARSEGETTVRPADPHGFHHHLIHRKEAHYEGERVPEDTSFYEQVARDLVPAREIVLIGHGTGKSNALDFLMEYLKTHHPTIFQKVIATEVVDLSALTEREIEAIARSIPNHISFGDPAADKKL